MKKNLFTAFCLVVTTILVHVSVVFALEGDIVIHDPQEFEAYTSGGQTP